MQPTCNHIITTILATIPTLYCHKPATLLPPFRHNVRIVGCRTNLIALTNFLVTNSPFPVTPYSGRMIGNNNQTGWNVRNQKRVFWYLTLRPNNNSRGMNVPRLTESTCASVGSNGACDQCTAIAISVNPVGNCGD